jgi:hypothetical protein
MIGFMGVLSCFGGIAPKRNVGGALDLEMCEAKLSGPSRVNLL